MNYESTTYLIYELAHILERLGEHDLREFNISYRRFTTLRAINLVGAPTQHALAVKLNFTDASISRMLGILTEQGLVKSSIDSMHLRKRIVTLTPKGKQLLRACETKLQRGFKQFLAEQKLDVTEYDRISKRLLKALKAR